MRYLLGSLLGVLNDLQKENTNKIHIIQQKKSEIQNKHSNSPNVNDTLHIFSDCLDSLQNIVVPREI